ncbi:MAG: HD-GYP domain-containing protein [bacterium]
MQQVSIKEIKPGAILATNINARGKVLYRRGHKLLKRDIDFLRQIGLRSLPVSDKDGGTHTTGTIGEETREEAVSVVTDVLNDFENLTPKKFEKVRYIAEKIVDDILSMKDLKIQAHDLRSHDEYTYRHSVNVTALSVSIAKLLNWDARDLRSLAAGALMHDIGKMKLPHDVLRKEGRLDREERLMVERHPAWGFQLLSEKSCGTPHEWAVARQHHETLDGRGYPDGRMDSDMHPWAKIVAVADIWDALRSNRPYKKGWPADKVLSLLNSEEMKTKLDLRSLEVFNQIAVPYPLGTQVRLTNNEVAVVIEQNFSTPLLPTVRIIKDASGNDVGGSGDLYVLQKEYAISISETLVAG